MKSCIREILTEALKDAEDDRRVWIESIDRLRKDKGNPDEIEKRERWLAIAVEKSVQIREVFESELAAGLPSEGDKEK